MTQMRLTSILILIICTVSISEAKVRLPVILRDNVVLQRDANIPIWGWADANGKIVICAGWLKEPVNCIADNHGKWLTKIRTGGAGGPYVMSIICDDDKVEIKNILLGEVWLCSGQSNMQWPVAKARNGSEEIKNADYPQIRLFTVGWDAAALPLADCRGNWQECSPPTIGEFSATAYYFGRRIHKALGVPVGLINSSWGATTAEAWVSRAVLDSDPNFSPILQRYNEKTNNFVAMLKKYEEDYCNWTNRLGADAGKDAPVKPSLVDKHTPSALYNAMLRPLIPFCIRGVIWYQGEANSARAYQYRAMFPALIESWRNEWGQGDFPFYFVQIAPYRRMYPELREAQLMAYRSVKNTGIVITTDIGDPMQIHPANKQDVGERLARWAMARTYGIADVAYSGPLYREMKIEGDKIRVYFDFAEKGLIWQNQIPGEFIIAGQDRKFYPAQVVIDGNSIIVSSPEVPKPVAVRFGWRDISTASLFNIDKLPASPFRTDDWPSMTYGEK